MVHDNNSFLYEMYQAMEKPILSVMFRLKAIPMHALLLHSITGTSLAHKIFKTDLQFQQLVN